MPATTTRRTLDELASLGRDIFDRQVQPALRPEDHGKFVAVDVDTGDYEMDENDHAAVTRLRSRKAAAEIWLMCAGYPPTYRIGVAFGNASFGGPQADHGCGSGWFGGDSSSPLMHCQSRRCTTHPPAPWTSPPSVPPDHYSLGSTPRARS